MQPVSSLNDEDYVHRLLRVLFFAESTFDNQLPFVSLEAVEEYIKEFFLPLLFECANMPFLPPPDLIILYQRCFQTLVKPNQVTPYLQEKNNFFHQGLLPFDQKKTLKQFLIEAKSSKSSDQIDMVLLAKVLYLLCPYLALENCYQGSISKLISLLQDSCYISKKYYTTNEDIWEDSSENYFRINESWIGNNFRSYRCQDIEEHLKNPSLQYKKTKHEQTRHKMDQILQAKERELRKAIPQVSDIFLLLERHPRSLSAKKTLQKLFAIFPFHLTQSNFSGKEEGYSNITAQGKVEHLLPSNFLYPNEEFIRRFIDQELLFYERENLAIYPDKEIFLYLDASPTTWGSVRFILGCFAILILYYGMRYSCPVYLYSSGKMDLVFSEKSLLGKLESLLDHQHETSLASDLEIFFQLIEQKQTASSILYICTEQDSADQIPPQFDNYYLSTYEAFSRDFTVSYCQQNEKTIIQQHSL